MATIDRNYESDFYAWANEQAAMLRDGRLAEADIEHIALEIESMGKTEKRELVARLTILLLHLLKWRFQPDLRGRSWGLSIKERRKEVVNHLADNPSLKSKLPEAMAQAYDVATVKAAKETAIDEDGLPAACPWTFEEAVAEGFLPE